MYIRWKNCKNATNTTPNMTENHNMALKPCLKVPASWETFLLNRRSLRNLMVAKKTWDDTSTNKYLLGFRYLILVGINLRRYINNKLYMLLIVWGRWRRSNRGQHTGCSLNKCIPPNKIACTCTCSKIHITYQPPDDVHKNLRPVPCILEPDVSIAMRFFELTGECSDSKVTIEVDYYRRNCQNNHKDLYPGPKQFYVLPETLFVRSSVVRADLLWKKVVTCHIVCFSWFHLC